MPTAPPRQCDTPGCKNTAEPRSWYCAEHQKKAAEVKRENDRLRGPGRGRPWQRLYYTKAWRQHLKPRRLAEYPMCEKCGREGSYEVHHKIPHKGDEKLFYDYSNLMALCKSCHSEETARERTQARAGNLEVLAPTGSAGPGRQWTASSNQDAIERALADTENLDDVTIP